MPTRIFWKECSHNWLPGIWLSAFMNAHDNYWETGALRPAARKCLLIGQSHKSSRGQPNIFLKQVAGFYRTYGKRLELAKSVNHRHSRKSVLINYYSLTIR